MSTLFVDTINEKTSGNGISIPGHVVQVQYRKQANNTFTSTSSSMTDMTDWYVDITPKSASNLIIWQSTITLKLNDSDGYARFRIVDSNNSDAVWNTNTYMGSCGYYQATNGFMDEPLFHINTAGTTSAMRLQLQFQINSGGTLSREWSGSDDRIIMAMEIAQ